MSENLLVVKVDPVKLIKSNQQKRDRFRRDAEASMERLGLWFVGTIQREQLSGRPGLKTRTGNLKRSMFSKTRSTVHDVITTVGFAKRGWYAIVHQTGMTIKAKTQPYLMFKTQTATKVYSKKGRKLKRPGKVFSWTKTKQVTIPKRLTVTETWQSRGYQQFKTGIMRAMKGLTA